MTWRLQRRTLVRAAALALAVPYVYSANAQIAISTGINRSGRLRALSQRSAKAYTQEYLGVLPERASEIAQTAQRLISANLEEITKANPPVEIARLLKKTVDAAAELRALMGHARSKEGALAVSRQADVLLEAAEQVSGGFESLNKAASARLINMAARQRMLSQRMTKNHFLIAAGYAAKAHRDMIEADRATFSQVLVQLQNASLSTPGIRNELALAQGQWAFFDAALTKPSDSDSLRNVATTSERLLETMNNLTELYDAALKDLLGRA